MTQKISARLFKASRDFQMYLPGEKMWGGSSFGSRLIKRKINPIFAWRYIRGNQVKMKA